MPFIKYAGLEIAEGADTAAYKVDYGDGHVLTMTAPAFGDTRALHDRTLLDIAERLRATADFIAASVARRSKG